MAWSPRCSGVINLASLLALGGSVPPNPMPYRAVYAAAKAFIVTFTQALAGELRGSGVRVQVCLPGLVATEFHTLVGRDLSKMELKRAPLDCGKRARRASPRVHAQDARSPASHGANGRTAKGTAEAATSLASDLPPGSLVEWENRAWLVDGDAPSGHSRLRLQPCSVRNASLLGQHGNLTDPCASYRIAM
jgi:NAD(P)-dependent dehydrogenase (short-subunit alcohol dehydrogenase family)